MGQLVFPGVPVKFDRVRPPVGMAPRLGEHTAEVLADIGVSAHTASATKKHSA
jgi:crotonobetainyl-CoA:carnitine CoA-transferase CaiB-like acyl-CoA transferase